jgi:hypothetical protein
MKKFYAALLLALALAVGLSAGRPVSAQSQAATGSQFVAGNSLALTATPAAIVTAVSGKTLTIKALVITSTEASIVQFYSNSGTGEPIGAPIALAADVPLVIDEAVLGRGISTSSGEAIYASAGPGGTVTILARVQKD